jgi:hypothetical protein
MQPFAREAITDPAKALGAVRYVVREPGTGRNT